MFRWGRKKGSDKADKARDDADREGAEAPGGAGSRDADAVRADLLAWVAANGAQPRPVEELHTDVSMCDAGYIDSIRAADLLAHVQQRYRARVPEVELVGRLSTLDALIAHIAGGAGD